MKDLIIVMKFTMKEMIKRKSFIVSTIIILILVFIGFNIPNIIKSFSGEDVEEKLLISDTQNVFDGKINFLEQMDTGYEIEVKDLKYDDIKNKLEKGDIDSAIIVEKHNESIKIRYIVESMTMMDSVPENIINIMNNLYSNIQIEKIGLSQEQIKAITPNFEFTLEQTSDEEVKGNVVVIMLMSIVLFYGIYFCAYQVSSSITTEKTSKIMETLVTSTKPKTIILGKTIGIGLTGLLQMILFVGTAIICAKTFLDKELVSSALDVSNINAYLGTITIIYFILGYLEYSLLFALTGSTVSKPEDIQSANTPIVLITMVGFYLSYFTMINPTSELNLLASLLPISSPFCMPFRVMMGIADAKDILLSMGIIAITILIVAKVAIKIYSSAILNYGTKMNFKEMLKVYKDKNN